MNGSAALLRHANARLRRRSTSTHFTLHYAVRNASHGPGRGEDGLPDSTRAQRCLELLESAYALLAARPGREEGPPKNGQGKVPAYLLDQSSPQVGSPLMFPVRDPSAGGKYIPVLFLPARPDYGDPGQYDAYLRSCVAHELMHAFNFAQRPLQPPPNSDKSTVLRANWSWLDEGLAVAAEIDLFPGIDQWLAYAQPFSDTPHLSFGASSGYHSVFLVRYLVRRFGPGFVDRIWVNSKCQSALLALSESLSPNAVFCSAAPDVDDAFASGFCRESWFVHDAGGLGLEPEVGRHFGGRAVTHSWKPAAGTVALSGQQTQPLACRYYRVALDGSLRSLRIEITPVSNAAQLKAELVPLASDGLSRGPGPIVPFRRGTQAQPVLTCDIRDSGAQALPRGLSPAWLLVVTNCAWPQKDHFDLDGIPLVPAEYSIAVSSA